MRELILAENIKYIILLNANIENNDDIYLKEISGVTTKFFAIGNYLIFKQQKVHVTAHKFSLFSLKLPMILAELHKMINAWFLAYIYDKCLDVSTFNSNSEILKLI